jgi:hypothetical protein
MIGRITQDGAIGDGAITPLIGEFPVGGTGGALWLAEPGGLGKLARITLG